MTTKRIIKCDWSIEPYKPQWRGYYWPFWTYYSNDYGEIGFSDLESAINFLNRETKQAKKEIVIVYEN